MSARAAIRAGDLWESIEHPSRDAYDGDPAGLCVVVGPNVKGRVESPDSHVMMRLTPGRLRGQRIGQVLYMHADARLAGRWVRRGVLAVLDASPEVGGGR